MLAKIKDLSFFLQQLSTDLNLPDFTIEDNFTLDGFNTETLGPLLVIELNKQNGTKVNITASYSFDSKKWESIIFKNISKENKIKIAIELIKGGRTQSFIAKLLGVSQSAISNYVKYHIIEK